uniref:Metaxin-1 n=1 Tax=Otus sunia TaxID=257818 RepID=A0A8C8B5D0_9STRI
TISKTQQIITHLRKQKYNADYDLSATQGADTLAFVSLLEEKLLPVLIHTFWVDAKNYVEHTRKWYAETVPFPLNFFLPNCMHKRHLERLQLMWGDGYMEDEEKLEKELYRDARECLTLLSQRLGSQKFFFGDSPASLDAFVFSRLAPLLKAKLPNGKLQQHLKSLQNLCNYCTSILSLYFPWDGGETRPLTSPHGLGVARPTPTPLLLLGPAAEPPPRWPSLRGPHWEGDESVQPPRARSPITSLGKYEPDAPGSH